ncbi:MAG: DUF1273 family protein [Acidimicrobiia bacterium]|nr:DUF1273 family protein [Acidimicrobiia bacterium]
MMVSRTIVYTDGACSGNPGPGGWAWAVPDGPYASGAVPHTTNQRMELSAGLDAVTTLDHPLEVRSDSTYIVNCFRDRWWEGWIARDWKNSQRKPVANRDLWEPLVTAVNNGDVVFRWVKGHSGDKWNDFVDALAVESGADQKALSGVSTDPESEIEAIETELRMSSDHEGQRILITGHRPPELGGYDDTEIQDRLLAHLCDIVRAKVEMHDDLVVVSGMGLGTETLGVEAAVKCGVDYIPVLPFPGMEEQWPKRTRDVFQRLMGNASEVVTLDRSRPDSKQGLAASFARRDAWLRQHTDEAVVVWDGEDGYLAKQVRSIRGELGEENVWVVDPAHFM